MGGAEHTQFFVTAKPGVQIRWAEHIKEFESGLRERAVRDT